MTISIIKAYQLGQLFCLLVRLSEIRISLGSRKRILVALPLLVILVSVISFSAPGGRATSTFVLDGSSPRALYESTLGCVGIGGSWSNSTVTCELSGNATFASGGGLTIDPSAKLVIDFNATFNLSGLLLNNESTIANTGTIAVNGTGAIDNTGTLGNNYGVIANSGAIVNAPDGTIDNYGVVINNYGGVLNNTGTVTNVGLIDDTPGASIDNFGAIANVNDSSIANFGTFTNAPGGTIDNTSDFTNGCGGSINNSGQIAGNPVKDTCSTPASSGPSSTSTVPEFPVGSLGIAAFATIAVVALLAGSSNGAQRRTGRGSA